MSTHQAGARSPRTRGGERRLAGAHQGRVRRPDACNQRGSSTLFWEHL